MELQALQSSGWSINILKECFPESLRRKNYWRKYCVTIRVPSDRSFDAGHICGLLQELFKINRRRPVFRRHQPSNAYQSTLLIFLLVTMDSCAICKDFYQICDVGLVKTWHSYSIISKTNNNCYFCSLFGDKKRETQYFFFAVKVVLAATLGHCKVIITQK